jgi:glycosyltransferase involved in cell wall biosynthesis
VIERRRILALSFFPAFVPPNNGGVERLYNFYAELSRYHDVTLISSSFLGVEREVVRHRPSFTEIRVPKDGHFARAYEELSKAGGAGDVSGPALGSSLSTFGAIHDEYLACHAQTDVIIHDSPFLVDCDLFRGFDTKVRIYNSYNCETDLYASLHAEGSEPGVIARLVRDLEAELCRHCDLITVCSEEDAAAFRRHFEPAAPMIRVPNGFIPGPPLSDAPRERRSLVFVGSAHKPNVDAVRLIVDELAPKLPDVEFHLVGSCHPAGKSRNVTAHGVVSQVEKTDILRRATAAINPMTSGGGSSLKIADIASNGCPLISTHLGARGFGLEAGVHYIALDPQEPAGTIRDAIADAGVLRQMADRAHDHFERHYSWREIAAAFVAELDLIAPAGSAAPAARLVVNDYDSLGSVGGGATRTAGLCKGLSETSPVIFLAFADDNVPRRRVSDDGRVLSLLVDKSPRHREEHALHNSLHWVSTADVVSYRHGPDNPRLMALFRCAAASSSAVVCEHPYMVGLPRAFGVDFVYSSQNFEAALKTEGLAGHPLREQVLPLVDEAERFACAASTFIVAVSEADATALGAAYPATAPILVIPNGSEGPASGEGRESAGPARAGERPVALFMGSVHGPNYEAAQWIATELAASVPECDFIVIGSVASSLEGDFPPNVRLVGEVSAVDKTKQLHAAQVALNPMMSGSGSNVKMADYLQHGLPVLTTTFGARGYEWVPGADATVCALEEFKRELTSLLKSDRISVAAREARQATYAAKLAMDAGGRRLARLIEDHGGVRKRALYVTYRYNDRPRGGGEEYVDRLVHAIAASGWQVDVVSPAVERIVDVDRFAGAFFGGTDEAIPTGHERVSSIRFPVDAPPPPRAAVKQVWNAQPDFEEHVAKALTPPPGACLAWGWADLEGDGRWCLRNCGVHLSEGGALRLKGRGLGPVWMQIFSHDGRRLHEMASDGDVDVTCEVPPGYVSLRFSMAEDATQSDPRPLALFVNRLEIGGRSILGDRVSDVWSQANGISARIAALTAARTAVRDPRGLELSVLRSPSDSLDRFVRAQVADYDLLITHNAIFKSTIAAIDAAESAGVPSVLIPHLHYDDDFYHFQDVHEACARASRTLVCPLAVQQRLADDGLTNVTYLSPGVEVSTRFSDDDAAAFREAMDGPFEDFFLVLGRKAAAKGYADIIGALDDFPGGRPPSIVMIGADDDGAAIDHPRVVYLGRQPDDVVRGALRECLGLINMSRSESFGMVLLQAGLAGKAVVANRECAAFADIVEDGANGFLASREELPSRMFDLVSDPALREKLGREGRRRAMKYDWEKIEAEFLRVCNSLVKQ